MQSLRTRRPSESRSKSQSRQSKPTKAPSRSLTRKTTSRVDDKIKKRMSMRYADISGPTSLQGAPPVPTLPIGIILDRSTGGPGQVVESPTQDKRAEEELRAQELKLLDQEDFEPDAYLKLKLANSTEAEVRTLQSTLQTQKDDLAQDLKRDVFKNYAEFVQVSKEVSILENEMLEFKECLADWRSMPSLLHIDDAASAADRRRTVRSSVADLRVLYAHQMQTLHAQIEGSAKFVPTTSGRHIVSELDSVLALNPATYKVDHACRFVILDDAVLCARRRRRRNNAESDKLVAEKCWPLHEMLVLDTKDTANLSNVFKIRYGKETQVYRTETASDKRYLLQQFRQAAEELMTKRRKEREGEHLRRKSMWAPDRASMAFNEPMPQPPAWLADAMGEQMGSSEKEKAERDGRWIADFSDELTVAIALKEWEKATALVEQGEEKISTMPALSTKLTPLKASLTAALLQSLSSPTNRKSAAVSLISLLVRLKAGAPARNTFLAVRADMMRKRMRMIRFEGSIPVYVSDLAVVVFTSIKHTAEWFRSAFRENELASFFVEWARKQVEVYAETFRKQVYSSDIDILTVEECVAVTHAHSKRLLEENGIDFRFLFDKLLAGDPDGPSTPKPLPRTFRHVEKPTSPIHTPSSTPVRSRSPAPSQAPVPARTPVPPVPPLPASSTGSPVSTVPPIPPLPGATTAPLSPRIVSPTPRSGTPSASGRLTPTSSRARASPAPPPRSRDRPGSSASHRPAPVALPKRDGMF